VRMFRSEVVGFLVAALALAPQVGAQQQANRWAAPKCDLKPAHYLVNSGLLYLKSATETKFEDQKQKDLRDARGVLTQALTTGSQDKNPAAWYYLARYYILTQDLVGADSAFQRAQILKPDCSDDITIWRRFVWVPLLNAGIAAWQANNTDSAIASFRRANAILKTEPMGFKYLASLLYNKGAGEAPDTAALTGTCRTERARTKPNTPADSIASECRAFGLERWQEYKTATDSAAVYFRIAADISAKDPKYQQDRRDALFNLARIRHSQKKWAEAEALYREYLTVVPNDPEGMASLGSVLSQTGQRDSAFALYRRIIAQGDSMGSTTLFRVGVEIFQGVSDPPDTAASGGTCRTEARTNRQLTPARIRARCDSVTKATMRDYDGAASVTYRLAAQAFEAGLKVNPYSRDGLYNLVNAYLQLNDSAGMLPVAQRLVSVDPMNRMSLRFLAFAHQRVGHVDSTLHYLRMADSTLSADVTISEFSPEDQSAHVKGLVTNVRSTPGQPFKLVFEFLNTKGEVVATQSADVPAIAPQETHQIDLKVIGAGIQAWRYHKE
jgi:tetratricopeptide (TPR) repeat protein